MSAANWRTPTSSNMNLFNAQGEWSEELLADCKAKAVPPNLHPLVLALPVAAYPAPKEPDPAPVPAAADPVPAA
jgi:hypothetical protein